MNDWETRGYFQEEELNSLDKKIIILYDYSDERCMSYVEVNNLMILNKKVIYTNCLSLFNTSVFNKGYDVIILKKNMSYIRMSEMALNKGNYGGRVTRTTSFYKCLISNALRFKKYKK